MGKGNLLYVLPGLLVYAIFVFIPILAAVALSLTEWNGLAVPVFRGVQNYIDLFSDNEFYIALRNNAEFIVFYCVFPLIIGIVLAAIISVIGKRERLVLRTMFFLPYIMPTAVLGIIFQWLYNPAFGPFNQILKAVGLGKIALPWLGDFNWVLPAVGAVAVWYFFGFCMVVFLTRHAAHRPVAVRCGAGRRGAGLADLLARDAAAAAARGARRAAAHGDRLDQELRSDLHHDARRAGQRHAGAQHLHV